MTQLSRLFDDLEVAEGSVTEYGMETVLRRRRASARIPVLSLSNSLSRTHRAPILLRGRLSHNSIPAQALIEVQDQAGRMKDYELNAFSQPVGNPVPNWQPPARPSVETLLGEYCRLERLEPSRHADSLYRVIADPTDEASWTYLGYGPFRSRVEYDMWLTEYCSLDDPQFYAIVDLASDQALGVAAYLRIAPANGSIEVGHIHFSRQLRRSRLATEAMALMMAYAFELGYRRYEWKCDALNAPSRRAAERLGFVFEGIFRQFSVVKGRNRDTAWYAILDRDWPQIQSAFDQWLDRSNFERDGRQIKSLIIKR